ncbi:MAG TPA: ABC transporter permease subunit [Pyrinomonadaceae bacterium]|nr:ABC transporter permease subunit [Pyrinomonadaceae bacterium]
MNMILAQSEIETRKQEPSSEMSGTAEKEIAAEVSLSARDEVHSSPPQSSLWKRIRAIARNAFREAVRDRVLYNLVFFVLLLIAGAIFLGELSDAQESKIIIDLGLSAMLLFGAFISIFVGVGLVYKEIERRTIYAIFAKPVGRGEFLVGKYLGLCLTLLVNVVVMGVGLSLALLYVGRGGSSSILHIWPAIMLIYVELMILTAVAILFSSFSSPALSALLTFFVFIIGHFSGDLKTFAASMGTTSARYLFGALFYLLPNLSNYSYITPAAHGQVPPAYMFFTSLAYALVYITVLLAAATLIFNRRNFK